MMDALERKRLLWGLSLNLDHPSPVIGRYISNPAPGWLYGFFIAYKPGCYRRID